MLIDLHCHLDFYKDNEIKDIVKRAKEKGVGIIVVNGVNPNANKKIMKLSKEYNEVKPSLGLYPIDSLSLKDEEIDKEIEFIRKNKDKIVAIGEVGLDFKEDLKEHKRQETIFEKIIKLSTEINKPLIVHSRKAEKECIDILEKNKAKKVIMHCFSGNFKLIERIIANGWSMTIPTNVTFSEHFQKAIGIVPIGQLFCETDSPYLHPFKQWKNEPANIIESYKKIAEIMGINIKEVEKNIEENYKRLFGTGFTD